MKKLFVLGLAALGFLAVSCSQDNSFNGGGGNEPAAGNGTIKVAVKGESGTSRAIGTPTETQEKTVKSFTVYVFNYSTGVLEKSQNFTSGLEGEINGLSVASQKRVVVFANQPTGFPAVTNYTGLLSSMIDLDTQVPDFTTSGLFMSGEGAGPVTLDKDNVTAVPVTVKRLTAKVRLGTLTVTPDAGLSLGDFQLTGVTIQKARNKAAVMGNLATSGFEYIGGLDASGTVSKNFLHESYQLDPGYVAGTPLNPNIYFYVFGNDDTDNEATIMSIYGEYAGTPMYYSFYINDKVGSGGSSTDGNYIERNKIYTINVTLKKLGNGGDNPNVPNEEATMNVEVSVADWEGELIQEVEW